MTLKNEDFEIVEIARQHFCGAVGFDKPVPLLVN